MESTSSFLYYTPDTTSQTKQHGHFLPHPNGRSSHQHSASACDQSSPSSNMPYPSALVYSRPTSSHLKPPSMLVPAPMLATGTLSPESLQKQTGLLTPSSPTMLGMDGPAGGDLYFFPSTPTLSNSSISTPPMSTAMTTPLTTSWSLDDCSGTVIPSEIQLPGTPDMWENSPPMTPAYIYPPNLLPANCSPSVLVSACPSLSPASDCSSASELDFCDPRKLTYPSPNPSASDRDLDLTTLPTICGDDDEHNFMLSGESHMGVKHEDKDFSRSFFGLDDLSDFDSDDGLVSGIMGLSEGTINPAALLGNKRERDSYDDDEDDTWGVEDVDLSDEESFLGDDHVATLFAPMSPPPSDSSRDSSVAPSKKRKVQRKIKVESYDSDAELDDIVLNARSMGYTDDVCDSELLAPLCGRLETSITPAPTELSFCESSDSQCDAAPAPVVRRGRKQSLTEDPSKTFVCHLCSRRFRRQEHLKRHFRSLHTKDKPFSCGECGKKFSRSDNLSQHARTHGSTTIHMALIDGEMMGEDDCDSMLGEQGGPLGIVLVDAAQASSGIKDKASPSSSESKKSRRKRRRDE